MKLFSFLYLNIYAFLLLGLGIASFLLPPDIFIRTAQFAAAAFLAFSGIGLFAQSKAKLKKVDLLLARSTKEFRRDLFKDIRRTFCGMLIVNQVLRDLRKTEQYQSLSGAEWKEIRRMAFGKTPKPLQKTRKHRRCFNKSKP